MTAADLAALAGLFASALLAATILPMQSEAVLFGLLHLGRLEPWLLLVVASVGNVLGSIVNWMLGRSLNALRSRRWFPVSDERLHSAEHWFRRFGLWSLLLSWVPLIGDPLTVVAGALRVPLVTFALIVGFAKTARYVAVILAASL